MVVWVNPSLFPAVAPVGYVDGEQIARKGRKIMAREIHIHVPAGLPDDEVIHVYLDTQSGGPAEPKQAPTAGPAAGDEQAIEERLAKLERLPSASPQLRAFVDGLRELKYTIKMPQGREEYLRVMDPEDTAHGAGYLRASSITFTRGYDREKLVRLGGGRAHSHGVRFAIEGGKALEAAKLVKRH